jgi:hypothetical protein
LSLIFFGRPLYMMLIVTVRNADDSTSEVLTEHGQF